MPQNQSSVRYVSVAERDVGQRVDNFLLRTLKGVPRSHVYRLLRSGQVRVNGGRAKPDRRLALGDQLRLPPVVTAAPRTPRRAPDELMARVQACICHEDPDYLVLNKPSDLAVHGGSGQAYGLIEVLRQARPADDFLELGHRLDLETSGCLVVARHRRALTAFQDVLRKGQAVKIYAALLIGPWQGGERQVSVALRKDRDAEGERSHVEVDPAGRDARSLFTPEKQVRYANGMRLSLMQIQIYTGRTHQIRVHAAHLGHPVAGDGKYGDFEANRSLESLGLKRMFLHARSLSMHLPSLDRSLEASVPLAPDLAEFLAQAKS